ncbi:AraC family transcriptional regulator [Polaribacter uvawellassae]|uniref:AraC family transcriptional regulator n=1 Tax=Polaribacter uvawellassae TaxID=3133495 RepID=UPI00321B3D00
MTNQLKKGEYFGKHYHKLQLDDFLITDTEYTHSKVDWHSHENPYFTYLIQGKLLEANKKETYYLKPGTLLFHNWQDEHYNIKPKEFTRGFHIELNTEWFQKYDFHSFNFQGSIHLENPLIKEVMNKIFLESKNVMANSQLSIDSLLVNLFSTLKNDSFKTKTTIPHWVNRLKEILHYQPEVSTSLNHLSSLLNIHPVHLSREFPKYFKTTIGNYIRKQKVNKAIPLILSKKLSMTEVCYECGFYDQSHFISSFKRIYGETPLQFFKKTSNVNFIQF